MGNHNSVYTAVDHSGRASRTNNRKISSTLNESTKLPPILSNANKHSEASSNTKKKFPRLGTIRRRLVKTLKSGKNSAFRRQIQELLQNWTVREIKQLIHVYERLEALKDLMVLSEMARQNCNNLQEDLLHILNTGVLSDLSIVYQNQVYPVHWSIVSCRCQFFSKYLTKDKINDDNTVILDTPDLNLSYREFSLLLKYIYSGLVSDYMLQTKLLKLGNRFGKMDTLDCDIRKLLKSDYSADVILHYPKLKSTADIVNDIDMGDSIGYNPLEILCHKVILAARSKYFCNLLSLKMKSRDKVGHKNEPLRLLIDEKVLPRCFIRVVLLYMYTDDLDLSTVIKWKVDDEGTSEAVRLLSVSELAMELFEIGQFLVIPALVKGCEDRIVENLNVSSLLGVLEWSSQPHGSSYVYRQAIQYFRDEFIQLCRVPAFLCYIPLKVFLEVIKSDYLQVNEEFLLASVIKWGEWQIAKANEKTGTNSPGNSLPRRSPKRRDINNADLLDIIAPLLNHVRLKHVLPINSSVLNMAYQRNLLQKPFPFDVLGTEKTIPNSVYWLSGKPRNSEYVQPRLFQPYVDEIKLILHERTNTVHMDDHMDEELISSLPDMLPCDLLSHDQFPVNQNPESTVDFDDETNSLKQFSFCQLEDSVIRDMVLMEKELKLSPEVLKALSLAPDCNEISEQIQLYVVRKFGLPDEMAAEVFRQVPDIVDSAGSSNSSQQNSLSKVGHLMKGKFPTVLAAEHCLATEEELPELDSRIMNISQSSTASFLRSPLDLLYTNDSLNREAELPNVILDL